MIPENVNNPELYKKAKKEADEKFDEKTSAYKSMWMVKRYKELGGTYTGKKQTRTNQWRDEEWIQVKPYVERKEKIECGSDKREDKACRPYKKVNEDTPMTIHEIVKKWGKEKVAQLASKKIMDMEGRLNWHTGTFTPSKR